MIRNMLLATAALAVATSPLAAAPAAKKASAAASATLPASNPFARASTLRFQAPDFSKIKDSDYLPVRQSKHASVPGARFLEDQG
jgi:peptidyl-dipeptidase Dcp